MFGMREIPLRCNVCGKRTGAGEAVCTELRVQGLWKAPPFRKILWSISILLMKSRQKGQEGVMHDEEPGLGH